jgi:hypothetical protein
MGISRLRLGATALLLSVAAVKPALADDAGFGPANPSTKPEEIGLEFHIDASYLVPVGRFAPGERIASRAPVLFPFNLDVGYRFTPQWFVGVHGLYAFGIKSRESRSAFDEEGAAPDWSGARDCPDCSHNLVRAGVVAEYRHPITASLRLALGLSSSLQIFNTTLDQQLQRSRRAMGWQFLELRAAPEWTLTRGLDIGPLLTLGVGRFWSETQVCANPSRIVGEKGCPAAESPSSGGVSRKLSDSGLNLWFSIGIRAAVLP